MRRNNIVVDTNVAVAANGRDTHADAQCQIASVEALRDAAKSKCIYIDSNHEILDEYKRRLNFRGAPGVGDVFFKYVFNNQYSGKSVRQVTIQPIDAGGRGYEELPANTLDPNDRKFLAVAVAVAAKADILNATDSDWSENFTLLASLSIVVKQICPNHSRKAE